MKKEKKEVVTESEVPEVVSEKSVKSIFPVTGADGRLIRTYTVDIHGEDAEKLAHQFATKVRGEIL